MRRAGPSESIFELSTVGRVRSLELKPDSLDDGRPAFDLARENLPNCLWRGIRLRLQTRIEEEFLKRLVGHHRVACLGELLNDLTARLCGSEYPVEALPNKVREPLIHRSRNVGRGLQSRPAADRNQMQLLRPMKLQNTARDHRRAELYLAGDKIIQRRAGATVGNMHDVRHPRGRFEELAYEMIGGARARGRVGH